MKHIRPELAAVENVPHGSTHRSDLSDFSSSVIPIDLSIVNIAKDTEFFKYPDNSSTELKEIIAGELGLHAKNIVCGNGASELIWLVGLATMGPNHNVGTLSPTFGEYARIAKIMGARHIAYPLDQHNQFEVNTTALAQWIQEHKINVFFLCNPNNPTGRYIPQKKVEELISQNSQCLFVIDAAYIDYTEDTLPLQKWCEKENFIALFSLTKAFGIAGIRSGYAVCNQPLAEALNKVRPAWNVNALAQKASAVLVCQRARFEPLAKAYRAEAVRMMAEFKELGLRVIPSDTDYFMVAVPNPSEFRKHLLNKGFLTRELASMGCNGFVRINVCDSTTNNAFIKEVRDYFR